MQKIFEYFKQFGVDANTIATILITLFVFSIGLFANWLAAALKSYKERKSYKKSLLLILKDFSKSCEKQTKVVASSLEKVGFISGNDFNINYVTIGTLEYLNKIDLNIFLKNFEPLFFKKKYSKAISKLFSLITHIKLQHDTLSDFLKMVFEKYGKHESQFYSSLESLRQIHDNLGMEYNGKTFERNTGGEFIQDYFNIFGEWERNGNKTDIASEYNEIVLKLLELNKKYQNIPLILQTNDIALKADAAYINIEKIDIILTKKIEAFIHFHRRAYKLINVIVVILK